MGARAEHSKRLCPENPPQHHRSHLGGQASLGLFGIPGANGCRQRPIYESQAVLKARREAAIASAARSDRELDERLDRLYTRPFDEQRRQQQPTACEAVSAQTESFVEYDQPQQGASSPLLLIVRQDRFLAMVRLDEYDQRPVKEVAAEWLSECQRLIGEDDPHSDCPPARLTDAMRLAQIHADERETYGLTSEEAYEAHCGLGAGYAETLMAHEG